MTGCFLAILIYGAGLAISWLSTCGLIYLVTLCFDWTFNMGAATGIWLILLLLGSVFREYSKK